MVAIIIIVIVFAVRSCGSVFGFASGVTKSTEKREKFDNSNTTYCIIHGMKMNLAGSARITGR